MRTAADGGAIGVTKLRGGASALLDELEVPATATQALIHVRDFTKGHPDIEANNHPIRHGAVVGIHNGIISNDDELLARYGIERAEPQMTVDSEAIFALMELRANDPRALSELRGAMAAAWLDERDAATLYLARGRLRPLWLGRAATGLYFASTRRALWRSPRPRSGRRLDVREVREGRLLHVVAGRVVRERRFRPDRRYREDGSPPARPGSARGRLVPRAPGGARSAAAALASRRARRRRPPRAGARARGTGTRSTLRAARRACGRPATRRGAPSRSRRASAQSAIFGRRPSRRASSAPCVDRPLEALLPLSTSNPASRSASPSEPNVCA